MHFLVEGLKGVSLGEMVKFGFGFGEVELAGTSFGIEIERGGHGEGVDGLNGTALTGTRACHGGFRENDWRFVLHLVEFLEHLI